MRMERKFNNLEELLKEYYELIEKHPDCLKPYARFKPYLVNEDDCCGDGKCINRPEKIQELVDTMAIENKNGEERLEAILELFSHGGKINVEGNKEEYPFERVLHSATNKARLPIFFKAKKEENGKIILQKKELLEFGKELAKYIKECKNKDDIKVKHNLIENENFKKYLNNNIDALINEILFWYYYNEDKFFILNSRLKNSKHIFKIAFKKDIPSKDEKFMEYCREKIGDKIVKEYKGKEYTITKNLMLDQLFYAVDEMKNTSKIENEYKNDKDNEIYKFYIKLWNTIKDAKSKITGKEDEFNDLLKKSKNIIFYGAPGTGKTWQTQKNIERILDEFSNDEIKENRFLKIVFHPNYTYEDFIRGYKPKDNNGNIILELVDGKFKKFCDNAKKYEKKFEEEDKFKWAFFVLVDEINRANLSSVFGEIIYALEEDKRGEEIDIQYSDDKFSIPKNLYFIGTMNDIDRSIDTFDLALRRRFMWVRKSCDYEVIYEELKEYENIGEIGENPESGYLKACFELNKYIIKELQLDEGFELGHSYFLKIKNFLTDENKKIENKHLKNLFEFHIEPLLVEYLRAEYDKNKIDEKVNEAKKRFKIENDKNS
jgi:5-methylcytosine-specific restriction protein B